MDKGSYVDFSKLDACIRKSTCEELISWNKNAVLLIFKVEQHHISHVI